jgi:hypothetical protein
MRAAAGPVAVGRRPPNSSNLPLCSLERARQARNWEVVNVLTRVGVALWQTENGRAMLHRLLHEFRPPPHVRPSFLLWRQKRVRDKSYQPLSMLALHLNHNFS